MLIPFSSHQVFTGFPLDRHSSMRSLHSDSFAVCLIALTSVSIRAFPRDSLGFSENLWDSVRFPIISFLSVRCSEWVYFALTALRMKLTYLPTRRSRRIWDKHRPIFRRSWLHVCSWLYCLDSSSVLLFFWWYIYCLDMRMCLQFLITYFEVCPVSILHKYGKFAILVFIPICVGAPTWF